METLRARLLIVILFLGAALGADSDALAQTTWVRAMDLGGSEMIRSTEPTPDGGWILVGSVILPSGGGTRTFIVKLDRDGHATLSRLLGDSAKGLKKVVPDKQGGYIALGSISSGGSASQPWVLALDSGLNVVWERSYAVSYRLSGSSICPTSDGGYLLIGTYYPMQGGPLHSCILVKLNASGIPAWARTLGNIDDTVRVSSALVTGDGGFLLMGDNAWNCFPCGLPWIAKWNPAGGFQWQKWVSGLTAGQPLGAIELHDGGYLVTGSSVQNIPYQTPAGWVIKLGAPGNVIWSKVFTTPATFLFGAAEIVGTHEYRLSGTLSPESSGGVWDTWMVGLTSDGSIQWHQSYGMGDQSSSTQVHATDDHHLLLSTSAATPSPSGTDVLLLKTTTDGALGGYCPFVVPAEATAVDGLLNVINSDYYAGSQTVQSTPIQTPLDPVTPIFYTLCPCSLECQADASPSSGAAPLPVQFTGLAATSALCKGTPDYSWDFGDGATGSGPAPIHTYATGGFYTWVLTATQNGMSCTMTGLVRVCSLACTAQAAPTSGVVPLAVTFQANASPLPSCTASPAYHWDFGDGTSSSEQNPVHTYNVSGTMHWTMTVTSGEATCTRSGLIEAKPYDLLFYDDQGRCRTCANSITGAWSWQILTGSGIGTYTGTALLSLQNGVLFFVSRSGDPFQLRIKYYRNFYKATGFFTYPAKRLNSILTDANTRNNPPGC